MYKLIYLARRNPEIFREDWPRTWRSHAIFASQFPVIASSLEYLRYCNRLDAPAVAGLSTDHDGVAVLSATKMADLDGSTFGAAVRAQLDEDELRVFDRPVIEFSFYCEEQVIRDGPLEHTGVLRFQSRAQDAPTPASASRHVINRALHEPPGAFPFTWITESWFPSVEAATAALADYPAAQDGDVTMLVNAFHRWPHD